jgi:taurine--2-oxoglutarate transaminase
MTNDEMVALCKRHTLYTWAKQSTVQPMPMESAEGIWITMGGRRYLDFNSQLMSVLIGHSHPRVKEAMKRQIDELIFAHPQTATKVRARLAKKLADLMPGDLKTFFFTLGGAEANENAIRIAKAFTGRPKVMSRYRSYHGSTNLAMQLTGDPRRWPNEPGAPGIIRVMDPWPYKYSFGNTEAEITQNNLTYLEEMVMYEGPQTIAALIIEPVTGTNGVLRPPDGYLQGVRALCDRHGILLICDEVMAGFGRTGKLFAFQHGDIVPDLVTMAKGLTSSYLPLGAVAMRDRIARHFDNEVFWGGMTYNSHPMCLACAEAVIDVTLEEGLVENAARLERVARQEMDRLKARHPSVREGRCIGLFGMVDLQKNGRGEPLAPYNGTHPAMNELNQAFLDGGLFTFVRWGGFMCNPPLCITEDELRMGYGIIDKALAVTDRAFED